MTGDPGAATLADLLFPPPGEPAGDDEAVLVHVDDTAWARGWVRTRAQSVADALAAAGVVAGDRVGVMLPNGVDVIAALFGTWRAGATSHWCSSRRARPGGPSRCCSPTRA